MHAVYLLENLVPTLDGIDSYVWVLDFTGIVRRGAHINPTTQKGKKKGDEKKVDRAHIIILQITTEETQGYVLSQTRTRNL